MKVKLLIIILVTSFISSCLDNHNSEGARLYLQHCTPCHMENGEGLKRLIPPLTNTEFLQENRSNLPCWIKHGMSGPIQIGGVEYDQIMPGVPTLTDTEIANILNFIQTAWHEGLTFISENEVKDALKECE